MASVDRKNFRGVTIELMVSIKVITIMTAVDPCCRMYDHNVNLKFVLIK